MSSKLKARPKKNNNRLPFSNMKAQHMASEFHATRNQLKSIEEHAYNEGWEDSENWTNIINTITLCEALHDLYGFGDERCLKVIKRANEITDEINQRKRTVSGMIAKVESRRKIQFDKEYKELVRRIGL